MDDRLPPTDAAPLYGTLPALHRAVPFLDTFHTGTGANPSHRDNARVVTKGTRNAVGRHDLAGGSPPPPSLGWPHRVVIETFRRKHETKRWA